MFDFLKTKKREPIAWPPEGWPNGRHETLPGHRAITRSATDTPPLMVDFLPALRNFTAAHEQGGAALKDSACAQATRAALDSATTPAERNAITRYLTAEGPADLADTMRAVMPKKGHAELARVASAAQTAFVGILLNDENIPAAVLIANDDEGERARARIAWDFATEYAAAILTEVNATLDSLIPAREKAYDEGGIPAAVKYREGESEDLFAAAFMAGADVEAFPLIAPRPAEAKKKAIARLKNAKDELPPADDTEDMFTMDARRKYPRLAAKWDRLIETQMALLAEIHAAAEACGATPKMNPDDPAESERLKNANHAYLERTSPGMVEATITTASAAYSLLALRAVALHGISGGQHAEASVLVARYLMRTMAAAPPVAAARFFRADMAKRGAKIDEKVPESSGYTMRIMSGAHNALIANAFSALCSLPARAMADALARLSVGTMGNALNHPWRTDAMLDALGIMDPQAREAWRPYARRLAEDHTAPYSVRQTILQALMESLNTPGGMLARSAPDEMRDVLKHISTHGTPFPKGYKLDEGENLEENDKRSV